MASARALARPPAVDDDDVAELRAEAVPAAERRAAGDDAAAHARPEREHHEVVLASPGACPPLADRGRVRVVVEPDREAEPLMHPLAQGRVLERQVDAADDDAALPVYRRRRAEADGGDRVVEELGDGGLELGEDVLLQVLRSRPLVAGEATLPSRTTSPARDLPCPQVQLRSHAPPAQRVTITRKPASEAASAGTGAARGNPVATRASEGRAVLADRHDLPVMLLCAGRCAASKTATCRSSVAKSRHITPGRAGHPQRSAPPRGERPHRRPRRTG